MGEHENDQKLDQEVINSFRREWAAFEYSETGTAIERNWESREFSSQCLASKWMGGVISRNSVSVNYH